MTVEYRVGAEGTVTPPADMMQAARLSLTPTGFENLMARTSGRAPTPAELVEFADAERAAGIVHAHECNLGGEIAAGIAGANAEIQGKFHGGTIDAKDIAADTITQEELNQRCTAATVVLPGDHVDGWDANQAEHGFAPLTSSD